MNTNLFNQCPLCKEGVLLLDYISMVKNYYRCTKCNKVFTSEVVYTFVEDNYDEEAE
jgi:transposase-like protein